MPTVDCGRLHGGKSKLDEKKLENKDEEATLKLSAGFAARPGLTRIAPSCRGGEKVLVLDMFCIVSW